MSDPIIYIIYTIVIVGIIGGFIAYKYKILEYKRTKFIAACVEFEQSFAETIHWLKENTAGSRFPGDFKVFKDKHIAAVSKFRPYLSRRKKIDFDNACKKFFNEKHGYYYGGYGGDKKVASPLALDNLNKLLKFAKH